MIHTNILLPPALALMPSFTGVLSVINAPIGNADIRSAIIEKFEENAEFNDFFGIIGGRIDFGNLTDKQKAEFAEKAANFAENGKPGFGKSMPAKFKANKE